MPLASSAWLPRLAPMAVALVGAVALFIAYLLAPRRRVGSLVGSIGAALLFLANLCGGWLTTLQLRWMIRSALPPRRTVLLLENGRNLLSLVDAVALGLLIVGLLLEGRRAPGGNP
jgi:hypothetical protein